MRIIAAMLGGFILDWIFGDPAWLMHPVVIMGKAISALEAFLRKHLPNTPKGERMGGLFLAMTLPVGTLLLTGGICRVLSAVHPALGFAVELLWCMQALAATGLAQESTNVYRELVKGDLPAARKEVSRIVGRDTQALTSEGVTKAAVETVAENASDGVIAPLFYMMLGGAPLALTYKAVNTMDSMVNYKMKNICISGRRAAAKLVDGANYPPSRALLPCCGLRAAALTGTICRRRIWKRDRRSHASPNSAQTESACARIRRSSWRDLRRSGNSRQRRLLGDATRPIETEDIAGESDDARGKRAGAGGGGYGTRGDGNMKGGSWRRLRRLSGKYRADVDFSANVSPLGMPAAVAQAIGEARQAYHAEPDIPIRFVGSCARRLRGGKRSCGVGAL